MRAIKRARAIYEIGVKIKLGHGDADGLTTRLRENLLGTLDRLTVDTDANRKILQELQKRCPAGLQAMDRLLQGKTKSVQELNDSRTLINVLRNTLAQLKLDPSSWPCPETCTNYLERGVSSQIGPLDTFTSAVAVNMGVKGVADAFDLGNLIVDTHVGHVNGKFGMLMSVAPGKGPTTIYKKSMPNSDPLDGIEKKLASIKDLPPDKTKFALRQSLCRQLNQLQWLDLLVGSSDRHGDNYHVYISDDNSELTVTGIDNDSAFPTTLHKLGVYEISKAAADRFKTAAKEYSKDDDDQLLSDPNQDDPGLNVIYTKSSK